MPKVKTTDKRTDRRRCLFSQFPARRSFSRRFCEFLGVAAKDVPAKAVGRYGAETGTVPIITRQHNFNVPCVACIWSRCAYVEFRAQRLDRSPVMHKPVFTRGHTSAKVSLLCAINCFANPRRLTPFLGTLKT